MSEFTQAVIASLTSEWRSTSEIASGLPNPRRANPLTAHVYKVLSGAERSGLAERQTTYEGGKKACWRRRA